MKVSVEIGMVGAEEVEIISGLEPQDTVIVSNMSEYDGFSEIRIK